MSNVTEHTPTLLRVDTLRENFTDEQEESFVSAVDIDDAVKEVLDYYRNRLSWKLGNAQWHPEITFWNSYHNNTPGVCGFTLNNGKKLTVEYTSPRNVHCEYTVSVDDTQCSHRDFTLDTSSADNFIRSVLVLRGDLTYDMCHAVENFSGDLKQSVKNMIVSRVPHIHR